MSYNNINELKGKIEAYRSRELNGERLPREEFEQYIGLKRELYHIENKQRLINARQTQNRIKMSSARDGSPEIVGLRDETRHLDKTAEVYDFEPMLLRREKQSRLRMLLDRFRRYQ